MTDFDVYVEDDIVAFKIDGNKVVGKITKKRTATPLSVKYMTVSIPSMRSIWQVYINSMEFRTMHKAGEKDITRYAFETLKND